MFYHVIVSYQLSNGTIPYRPRTREKKRYMYRVLEHFEFLGGAGDTYSSYRVRQIPESNYIVGNGSFQRLGRGLDWYLALMASTCISLDLWCPGQGIECLKRSKKPFGRLRVLLAN